MRIFNIILILVLLVGTVFTQTRVAAPNGTPSGDGSFTNPWDLTTALNKVVELNGNTLCLRGGVYNGKFKSYLTNAVVRSCTSENAIVDGHYIVNLGQAITATQIDIVITNSTFILPPAFVLKINNTEDVQISQYLGNNTYRVNRGWNGTTATSHVAGSPMRARGNSIEVWGNDTTYINFEVRDSNPTRAFFNTTGYGGDLRGGEGFMVFGNGNKLINLLIHDNADGIFLAETARNTEVYGNIIFNNGHVATDRPHGQGMYLQNVCPETDYIQSNIVFNNFGMGSKAYGAAQGHSECFVFEDGIYFNNGSLGYYAGTPTTNGGGAPNRRYGNLEVGSDVQPSKDIVIRRSLLYHQPDKVVEAAGLWMGRAPTGGNSNAVIEDNIVAEPFADLLPIDRWTGLVVRRNTLIFNQSNVGTWFVKLINPSSAVEWDFNTYIGNTTVFNTCTGSFRAPFHFGGVVSPCGSSWLSFAQWKAASGFDTNSQFIETQPTQNIIYVNANRYETGRGHIAVYNWENRPTVDVNISSFGLLQGQQFNVYNVQNLSGAPILSGTYNTNTPVISLSTADVGVTTAIGHTYTPTSTCPQFCVYLVTPLGFQPTASTAVISGRVITSAGKAVNRATLTLIGQSATKTAISNNLGYFTFNDVELGTYTLETTAKRRTFNPISLNVVEDITDLVVTAN